MFADACWSQGDRSVEDRRSITREEDSTVPITGKR